MSQIAYANTVPELPSLNGALNPAVINADLTGAGLLTERVELIARLYAEHGNWQEVRDIWHDQRVSERGSRGSAQKIFRILRDRLQAGPPELPPISRVAEILGQCRSEPTKSQLAYLYLVHSDALFQYVVHELLRAQTADETRWDLSSGRLFDILNRFRDTDGNELQYAASTRERWVQGFRSVMHDIGVRRRPYDDDGVSPTLEREVLLTAAGYSRSRDGEAWQNCPRGFLYLFQPAHHLETLFDRVGADSAWTSKGFQNRLLLVPEGGPFDFEL